MFFRIKKIKGNDYAYIVENEWKHKGSRQKVNGYIGRAYRFDLKNDVGFPEFLKLNSIEEYINSNKQDKMINDLIEWELYRFSISKEEFSIDLSNKKIQKKKKNVVLLVNDGFMCSTTLKNLIEFRAVDEQTDGYRLARAFVEAGIKVPQEVFVGLFSKLYKTQQKSGFEW